MRTIFFLLVLFCAAAVFIASCAVGDSSDGSDESDQSDNDSPEPDDDSTPDDDDVTPRSFALAAAPMQYVVTDTTIETVFDTNGLAGLLDVLALHMDDFFGIPWNEFAAGEDPPPLWIALMEDIRGQAQEMGVDVYLAISPLGGLRDRLAQLVEQQDGQLVFDTEWASTCFNFDTSPDAADVRAAYLAYVRWMVEFFQPDYLALAIEMNLFDEFCPDSYDSLIGIYNEAYQQEKTLNPDLPIYPTFQIDFMWNLKPDGDCDIGDRSCLEQALARQADVQRDRFAVSSYPMMFLANQIPVPDDFFTAPAEITGETLVIGETGFTSESVTVPYPTLDDPCLFIFSSSDQKQMDFMQLLFEQVNQVGGDLITWWSARDFLPASVLGSCPCDAPDLWCLLYEVMGEEGLLAAWMFWGAMGVIDYDLDPKPSLELWNEWRNRTISSEK